MRHEARHRRERGKGLKREYRQSIGAGTYGEQLVSTLLTAAGVANRKNPEKSDRSKMILWDLELELRGATFTAEVKFDQMESKTGNIAIEYFNTKQGKPSGILATSAHLWVVVLQGPESVWAAPTPALRAHFGAAKPLREIACGGNQNSAMKLYRRDDLFAAVPFARLDGLAPAALEELVYKLATGQLSELG